MFFFAIETQVIHGLEGLMRRITGITAIDVELIRPFYKAVTT